MRLAALGALLSAALPASAWAQAAPAAAATIASEPATVAAPGLTPGMAKPAGSAPHRFTGYRPFYESLGGNLFAGDGTALAQACTDTPRRCLWVNAMSVAVRRFEATGWIAPGELEMDPPKGTPGIGFDGTSLSIGERRWRLGQGTDLAAGSAVTPAAATQGKADAQPRGIAAVDPENLAQVTVWRRAGWACVELHFNTSGRGGRYPQVLVAQGARLYALPRLFSACAAVRDAQGQRFSYPANMYLGTGGEAEPSGLQVDYLLSDGKTREARYTLRYPQPENVFVFEVVPGAAAGRGGQAGR
ncbi:hypothetical protein A9974_19085 [Achromobacter sp. UMC71]|nr:hypothetical protein [Achromobacter sp. UMC71]